MNQPLDELYLTWLYSQVGSIRAVHPDRTHWSLIRQLFKKEFVWTVPNDDNRVEDGKDLRYEFMTVNELDELDHEWMSLGCSFLEMLIALSRRLSFEAEGKPSWWFWKLLSNLGIEPYSDSMNYDALRVDRILDQVIWRRYARDGKGGLFPLRHSRKDQRKIEIWYQLNEYLLEN